MPGTQYGWKDNWLITTNIQRNWCGFFVAFFWVFFVFKFKSEENNDFLLRRIVIICSTSWLKWKCWGHDSFSLSSSQDYSKKVKRKPLCEVEISLFGGNRAGLEYEGTIQDVHQGNNLKLFPKHKFLCKYPQFKPDWMLPEKKFLNKQIIVISKKYPSYVLQFNGKWLPLVRQVICLGVISDCCCRGKKRNRLKTYCHPFITLIPFLKLTSFYADLPTKHQLSTKVSNRSLNHTPWVVTVPIPSSNAIKTHFLSPEYFPPLLVNVYQLL